MAVGPSEQVVKIAGEDFIARPAAEEPYLHLADLVGDGVHGRPDVDV